MTEKQFKLSEPNGAYLVDGDKPLFHMGNDDEVVELLNKLINENEQLKRENQELKDLLNYADNLICHHTFQRIKSRWETYNNNYKARLK